MGNYCPHCGKPLESADGVCASCGSRTNEASPPRQPSLPYIPNNLALAIISTLFCWPVGIPAIVYAAQVDSLARMGQLDMANRYSTLAKKWSFGAIGSFVIMISIYILIWLGMFVFISLMSVANHHH